MQMLHRAMGIGLLMLCSLFILPQESTAETDFLQRSKCRWWKRHHAEAKISRLYYSAYSYYTYWVYNSACNCYQPYYIPIYNPHYYWNKVADDKDRGCGTASASTSYNAFINGGNRSASAAITVTNNNVTTNNSTNYGWLRAGQTGEATDGCYDVAGYGGTSFSAETDFGEEVLTYSNVQGILSTSLNSNFVTVLRIKAFESHLTEEMTEDEADQQDNIDKVESVFYSLEIRIKNGQVQLFVDGEGTPMEEIASQIEVFNEGDLMQAILNGLNFEVNIPSGVDVDNVAVHYFSDSYYDPTDALDCGGSGLEDASPNEMPALPQIQDAINTIEEDNEAFDVQVSPNPATTNFNLSYDLPEAHNVSIQLLDMQGRVVQEVTRNTMQEAGQQNRTINTNGLKPGTYICLIKADKKLLHKKLIIE